MHDRFAHHLGNAGFAIPLRSSKVNRNGRKSLKWYLTLILLKMESDMIFFTNQIPRTVQNQIAAFQSLAKLGYAGVEKLTYLNSIAARAALDNATHHLRNSINTKDVTDLVELQMQAIQPTAESAKIYARQVFGIGADVSSNFYQLLGRQFAPVPDK